MSENDIVQSITRRFLNEFVPQNIPAEAGLVDTVCNEYFKAAVQSSRAGKKHASGMKFAIDPATASFITPILAAVFASIAKTIVESAIAKRTKLVSEREILKALARNKEISPKLARKLATSFARFLQDHPDVLKEKA